MDFGTCGIGFGSLFFLCFVGRLVLRFHDSGISLSSICGLID